MVKKANLMLITFSAADPAVKTRLLEAYCLSLYGCALWNLSCTSLNTIEVAFNNILRRIWYLPHNCHTGILHLTVSLASLMNTVLARSSSLLSSAFFCPSAIVRSVFHASQNLDFTPTGYNHLYGHLHAKVYHHQFGICADIVRHHRLHGSPQNLNLYDPNDMIYLIRTSSSSYNMYLHLSVVCSLLLLLFDRKNFKFWSNCIIYVIHRLTSHIHCLCVYHHHS